MSSRTLKEAAECAGISERTLYSWLHEDTAFKQAYKDLRQRQLQLISDNISDKITEALAVLSEVMSDVGAKPAARVAAARIVIDSFIKIMHITELEERITEIERQLAEK